MPCVILLSLWLLVRKACGADFLRLHPPPPTLTFQYTHLKTLTHAPFFPQLLVQNAATYNGDDSDITESAQALVDYLMAALHGEPLPEGALGSPGGSAAGALAAEQLGAGWHSGAAAGRGV